MSDVHSVKVPHKLLSVQFVFLFRLEAFQRENDMEKYYVIAVTF